MGSLARGSESMAVVGRLIPSVPPKRTPAERGGVVPSNRWDRRRLRCGEGIVVDLIEARTRLACLLVGAGPRGGGSSPRRICRGRHVVFFENPHLVAK